MDNLNRVRKFLGFIKMEGKLNERVTYSDRMLADHINAFSSTYLGAEELKKAALDDNSIRRFLIGDVDPETKEYKLSNLIPERRKAIVEFITSKRSKHACISHEHLLVSATEVSTYQLVHELRSNKLISHIRLDSLLGVTYSTASEYGDDDDIYEMTFAETSSKDVLDVTLERVHRGPSERAETQMYSKVYLGVMINLPEDSFQFQLQSAKDETNLTLQGIDVSYSNELDDELRHPEYFAVFVHAFPYEAYWDGDYLQSLRNSSSRNLLIFQCKQETSCADSP